MFVAGQCAVAKVTTIVRSAVIPHCYRSTIVFLYSFIDLDVVIDRRLTMADHVTSVGRSVYTITCDRSDPLCSLCHVTLQRH